MSGERAVRAALRTAAAAGSGAVAVGAVGWAQHARLARPALSAADQSMLTAGYALARFGVDGVPDGRRRYAELAPFAEYGRRTGAFDGAAGGLLVTGRELMLVATLVAAVLLWALARRLLLGPLTAAAAVLLFGLPPFALRAHQSLDAAALALPWLLAALLVLALIYPQRGAVPAALDAEPAEPAEPGEAGEAGEAGEPGQAAESGAAGEPQSYFEAVVPSFGSRTLTAVQRSTRTGRSGLSAASPRTDDPPQDSTGVPVERTRRIPYARIGGWTLVGAFVLVAILTLPVAGAPVSGRTVIILGWPVVALALALAGNRIWRRLERTRTPEGRLLPVQLGLGVTAAAVLAIVVLLGRDAWRVPGTGTDDPAQQAADEAAHWLLTNTDGSQRVAVDDLTWVALVRGGYRADRLLSATGYGPGTAPDGLRLVIADPRQPDSVAAPARPALASSVAQARFTVAGAEREVRYVVADPAALADTQLRQRLACQLAGIALAGNSRLQLGPRADELLRAGDVDPRLITALAGVVAGHSLRIEDFPAVPGEEGTHVMRRVARLTEVDGTPAATSPALRGWLTAQLPPYRPSASTTDRDTLVVRYDPPTPVGLLVN